MYVSLILYVSLHLTYKSFKWPYCRKKGVLEPESWEQLVLANRDLGLGVGICTLIATEVGGAFVNGTAEEVYNR